QTRRSDFDTARETHSTETSSAAPRCAQASNRSAARTQGRHPPKDTGRRNRTREGPARRDRQRAVSRLAGPGPDPPPPNRAVFFLFFPRLRAGGGGRRLLFA